MHHCITSGSISHLWNLSQGFPIAQNDPKCGTFWYLRHLGSSGLLKKFKILICDFLTLKGNEGRRLPDTPLSPPTPSNNPKTPLKTPKHPQAPETHSPVPQEQPWPLPSTIQTVWEALELSKEVRGDSGRNEGVRRCLLGVRNVGECLWLPLEMSRICQGWYGSVWGCLGVSGGVRGSWKVLGGPKGGVW